MLLSMESIPRVKLIQFLWPEQASGDISEIGFQQMN